MPVSTARRYSGLSGQSAPDHVAIRLREVVDHARLRHIGVAEAAKYPNLTLDPQAALAAGTIHQLFSSAAGLMVASAAVKGPIFDGGKIDANVRSAEAQTEEARRKASSGGGAGIAWLPAQEDHRRRSEEGWPACGEGQDGAVAGGHDAEADREQPGGR